MDVINMLDDHDDSHEDHGGNNEVIIAKVVAMVVLFFASFALGVLPMILSKKFRWIKDDQSAEDIKTSNKLVVGLLSFGGGVLLSTTFLHLLPEVGENIKNLQEDGVISDFSFHLESLLMCCGFFIMYLVEELVHLYIHKRSHQNSRRQTESMLVRTLSVRHSIINNNRPSAITAADLIAKDPEKHATNVSTIIPTSDEDVMQKNNRSHSHLPIIESEVDDPIISSLRGLLIVLALSVHELFEGLAVGLESSAQNVWYMFGAVSAHKLVIAFCVGVELVTTKTKTTLIVIYAFAFAFVSPCGIGIGIALSGGEGASGGGLAGVLLQGLACGTLLYIVFFEILQRDRAGLLQLACCIIGFLAMFGFQFISPHDHGGHNHGGHDDRVHVHNHAHDHAHDHAHGGH